MIAGITKSGSFKKIISYNEKKVDDGTATRLYNNTLAEGTEDLNQYFLDIVNENKNVKTEKSQHIYISFPPGEEITNEQMVNISLTYLERMGYSNTPQLIYRHYDTDNEHLHIVTSTVDFEGKWLDTKKDFKRSQKISREIENEFGLALTIENKEKSQTRNLKEINAYKHSIQKAIKLKSEDQYFIKKFRELIPNHILSKILNDKSFSDNQISHALFKTDKGENFLELQQLLLQHNLIYKLKKDILIDKLKYIKSISKDYQDFKNKLEIHQLYIKEKASDKGKRLIYGDPNNNIYLNEKQQPKAFQFNSIVQFKETDSKKFNEKSQKRYLSQAIKKSLNKATSLKELENNLLRFNVEVSYSTNKSGISGISFKSAIAEDPITFKGSQLSYSIKTINEQLAQNLEKEIKTKQPKPKPNTTSKDIKNIGRQLDTDQDSEEQDDSLKPGKNL